MLVREIHWEITNACNLRCAHCIQSSCQPREDELNTTEALAAIDRMYNHGVERICWTGGEPGSRKDFLELLHYAHTKGMVNAVISNGHLLTDRSLDFLAANGVSLGLSFDGASAEIHDAIRGTGSYSQAEGALRQAIARGIPVTIYTTITRRNYGELTAIAAFAKNHGCSIHFNEISLNGRAADIWPRVALNEKQRSNIADYLIEIAQSIYGETPIYAPDGCWADGSSIYLRSDGQAFLCSEQVQHAAGKPLGHILIQPLSKMADYSTIIPGATCRYRVLTSSHLTLIMNQPVPCPLIPKPDPITTLDHLNYELDRHYAPFARDCQVCQDKCCRGFVWLMPEEAERLYEMGVPIAVVNDTVPYIHSFPELADGTIDISQHSPPCSQLCTLNPRQCTIYANRPFSCRLYPIGFEMRSDGKLIWALHRDCHITRQLENNGIMDEFYRRTLAVLDRISPELYTSIIAAYGKVNELATFPSEENNYCTLKEVRNRE